MFASCDETKTNVPVLRVISDDNGRLFVDILLRILLVLVLEKYSDLNYFHPLGTVVVAPEAVKEKNVQQVKKRGFCYFFYLLILICSMYDRIHISQP